MQELVVFDVCDTLFFSNTTFDFVGFVLSEKGQYKQLRQLELIRSKKSFRAIRNFIGQKITGIDYAKKQALALLKGFSKDELYQLGDAFFRTYLLRRRVLPTHAFLEHAKAKSNEVLLLSASIDPVVAMIAKSYNIRFTCSRLHYSQNICTGELELDMKGIKDTVVKVQLLSKDWQVTVFSDNFSDRDLLLQADHAVAIVYSKQDKIYWQGVTTNFIELNSK